jgi:hypothetical protein
MAGTGVAVGAGVFVGAGVGDGGSGVFVGGTGVGVAVGGGAITLQPLMKIKLQIISHDKAVKSFWRFILFSP